ncbi:uncharacterized protein A1O9_04205 [Exophiala aquamarina CBS 119918]|uniref:Amino-acid acetyltransferase, mitochondrial n=1 Tax=Exophiala aquamarina CBS 119918 TaxID=1182545 RepID=A0A072PHM7_9EURO|nr:uncharacterized protein A1O9_04205 [Exophiala aquamarina CBS 119918]KEF59361.1 hypothetical protein A1O9_04205 [Exophiala aquamarina CBS 119918]
MTHVKDDKNTPSHQGGWFAQREKQRLANKEFFTNLLSSAATKRDAKAYISRLKAPSKPQPPLTPTASPATPLRASKPQTQVNLGDLFTRGRAVEASPIFTQDWNALDQGIEEQETLHVALVKLNGVSAMSESILDGIAKTLASLSRLSMAPCVVLEEDHQSKDKAYRETLQMAADRLVAAIDNAGESGARRVDNALSLAADGRPGVFMRKLLTRPLRRGRVPIVLPVAYSEQQQSAVQITANEALLALTRELSRGAVKTRPDEHPENQPQGLRSTWKPISLDRIIVVDETGCIPSPKSMDQKHVFVNLAQEYSALQEELRSSTGGNVSLKHATNLKMFRDALQLLPHSSSGLLTTPSAAANTSKQADAELAGVGTRRQKNPLIHNLLTDKPAYSSSLPSGRLAHDQFSSATTSTFVKRGMPLILLPNPDAQTWTAASTPRLKLTDPRIDLDRLVHLIDDSFNRTLDVEAYLNRVNDHIAGVIIAGDYEGGAILTWETPSLPNISDRDTARLVPYLDKFAVLKKSQGAGGVADIVFNAMVRTCFPNGVCWRSRQDNPVNKWYFERSRGTWKIPNTNWTMFWTTPDLLNGEKRKVFLDYESVCRTVMPTWADGKKVVD